MPTIKSIAQLYKDDQQSFLKHLRKAKDLDEHHVHKLRVDIKNLRVLFTLMKIFSKENFKSKPMLKMLSPVFKRAGKIRTNTLNLKLTKSSHSKLILNFKEHLKKQSKRVKKDFLKEIKSFDKKKFKTLSRANNSMLHKLKPQLVKQKTLKQLEVELAKLRTYISETNSSGNLHEIRKKLKMIKNLGSILNEIDTENTYQRSLKKIDVVYKNIGEWHDSLMLLKALDSFAKSQVNLSSPIKSSSFIKKLRVKNDKNKLAIAKKLKV